MKTPFLSAFTLALAYVSCSAAPINLLVNGSFEQPEVATPLNFSGAFSFLGWSGVSAGSGVNGENSGIVPGINFGLIPFDGNQAFSFNGGNSPAGTFIEQAFPTSPGLEYVVSFAVGRNSGFANQVLELQSEVFDSSGNRLVLLQSLPPSEIAYSAISFAFAADSETTLLKFTDISSSNPNTDLFIDAVTVQEVPEPVSGMLICAGAFIYFGSRRLRRSEFNRGSLFW